MSKTRPELKKWNRPDHIKQYPSGPSFDAGHLVEKNAGWRSMCPSIDLNKCTACYRCYLLCPDGVIFKKDRKIAIDYNFCKGCGVCAYECPAKAISMLKESKK
jgi:pyruvate ferredoxin oxidoreductase delta subunit